MLLRELGNRENKARARNVFWNARTSAWIFSPVQKTNAWKNMS
jgi:hypothetical protein